MSVYYLFTSGSGNEASAYGIQEIPYFAILCILDLKVHIETFMKKKKFQGRSRVLRGPEIEIVP